MRRTIGMLVAASVLCAAPGAASGAAAQPPAEHCVVHVVGQKPSGELVTSDAACYSSLEEAMVREGVGAWGTGASLLAAAAATFTIGIHYDGLNFTGASTSVVGSDCSGGWLNVSAAWNNRISSTEHGCPKIRHYSGVNLTGSFQTTYSPGGNLTTLNNLTSSIRYLT